MNLGKDLVEHSVINDFLNHLIVVLDPEGKIIHYNRLCENFMGLPCDVARANYYWDVFCQREEKELYKAFLATLDPALCPFEVEAQIPDKDNSVKTVLWTHNVLLEQSGSIKYYVLSGTDITVQEKARNEAQEMVEKFRAIIHASPVAVLSLGTDLRVKSWSSAAEKLLEWSEKMVLGKDISLFLEDEGGTVRGYAEKASRGKIFNDIELDCYRKSGSPISVNLALAPLRNHKGEVEGVVLVAVDITRRRQAEEKLAEYTRQLEQLYGQLDEEMDKARRIHERAMPRSLPQIEGISLAAHYQPAKKLGGDFYNVIKAGHKLVLYLSDVTGHSLDGTILSVFIKEAIDSYISLKPKEIRPGKILRHLDRQYRRENYPEDYFISIFLAVLDLKTHALSYTSAGFQTSPLVALGGEKYLELQQSDLPIMASIPPESLEFNDERITLTPGATLFLSTDGLIEQAVSGKLYNERAKIVFYENAHLSPHLVVQAVMEDFRRFNNGSLQGKDDITFLVLQLDPSEKKTYQLELTSDFRELQRLRADVSDMLSSFAEAGVFAACLDELAANAIEHGNKFDWEKTVSVEISMAEGYIQATVEDQGQGFNWREKIDKKLELEGKQQRGRGIAMSRLCCDKIFYNDKGNSATIVVKTPNLDEPVP